MDAIFNLLMDLHRDGDRQGPGGSAETELAMRLAGLTERSNLQIADIGCGTGASSLVLARALNAHITAVDLFTEFLEELQARAVELDLGDKITTLTASMDDLPFVDNSYDVIWSEGAIYNMGFEKGAQYFRRFLKPGGVLAVSELTWLTAERPPTLTAHWNAEYPEVDTASAKMGVLEKHGFSLLGYFPLASHCWLENYYLPLQARHAAFLQRHAGDDLAWKVVTDDQKEIDLYEVNQAYVSYGFYIARKVGN